MKKIRRDSLAYQIQQKIISVPNQVIVRADVESLGDYRQVSRALLTLIKRGVIVRIGYGIYAKARYSTLLNKPVIQGGFKEVACEALNRLGIQWEADKATRDYNSGRSTQVPVNALVKLKERFRRTIAWEGMRLEYEKSAS